MPNTKNKSVKADSSPASSSLEPKKTNSSRGKSDRGHRKSRKSSNQEINGKASHHQRGGDGYSLLPELRKLVHQNLETATYIVFDIETTGGNPERNGITEIAALKIERGAIVDKFHTLVNPMIPIPPIVRRMTGITNQMVKDAPVIDEIFPDFLEFIGDHILVSHNTIGDLIFLRHFARDTVARDLRNFFLCTHLLVEKLAKEAPDKSLKGLSKFFDLAGANFHRAEADSVQTWELFKVLLKRLKDRGFQTVEHGIRLQGDLDSSLRLGWSIEKKRMAEVPQSVGVFYLYDHEKKLVFLSSALNLSKEIAKLEQYDLIPRQVLRLVLRSHVLQTKDFPNLFSAMLTECDGREEHKMQVDPSTLHQRQVQVLGVYEDRDENQRLTVGPLEAGLKYAFGPVKDRKRAMDFLADLADILGEKSTRNGMLLSSRNKEVVLNLLNGTLAEFQRKVERTLFGLKILFWRKSALLEQQQLLNSVASLTGLSGDGTPFWNPIADLHGFIFVPEVDVNHWQVYTILGGIPVKVDFIQGEWKSEVVAQIKAKKLDISLQDKVKSYKYREAYSHSDLGKLNTVVWWLQYGRSKDHGHFLSYQEFEAT